MDGEAALLVVEDNVASLRVGRDHACNGGKVVGIDDGLLRAHELGQGLFQGQMHVNGAIEAARPARANTIPEEEEKKKREKKEKKE